MPDSLEQLQQQRTDIIRQIGQLGDLRPGSITNTSGRCGNILYIEHPVHRTSCTSNILYIEHPVHRNG